MLLLLLLLRMLRARSEECAARRCLLLHLLRGHGGREEGTVLHMGSQ